MLLDAQSRVRGDRAGGRTGVGGLRAVAGSAQVAAVQRLLDYLGYCPGTLDGTLDQATRRALKAFQRQHGLAQTGSIDPAVLDYFNDIRLPPVPTPAASPATSRDLSQPGGISQPEGDQGANELLYTAGVDAYETGDLAGARQAWLDAAENGHPESQFRVGMMFDRGEGVVADTVSAAYWYQKAAAQDHVRAQTNLGVMYRQGDGIPKDLTAAYAWTERAALNGVARAQYNLGLMLAAGEGASVDYVEAYAWFAAAAAQGNGDAEKGMKALQALMTFGQLTTAKRRARSLPTGHGSAAGR